MLSQKSLRLCVSAVKKFINYIKSNKKLAEFSKTNENLFADERDERKSDF